MKIKLYIGIAFFVLLVASACSNKTTIMTAEILPKNGQYIICESGKPVLQYNYKTVYEQDVIRPESQKDIKIEYYPIEGLYLDEYFKSNPGEKGKTKTSQIWASPRSDYIHPLYGLNGEILTCDWPDASHPHHRGIFWAWPEVEYGTERSDLYALQRLFARPTGNIKCTNSKEFAEITAENLWMWEERKPLVREWVTMRAYRVSEKKRVIDIKLNFLALEDSVTIATRFTNSYGSFNVKLANPKQKNISYHTDTIIDSPRRSWADFSGIFEGSQTVSGVTVLQNRENPEYPGEWIVYPDLCWVQPAFPKHNTRYLLSKDKPLVLRYRLIVHQSGKPNDATLAEQWDNYHSITNL